MSHIALSVSGSLLQELSYEITCEGVESTMHSMKSELSAEDLLEQPGRFQELLPATLTQEIYQYVLNSREEALLVIESSKTNLDCLPWECLPALLELPSLFVVRCLARPPRSISKGDSPTRLLGVGWTGKPYFELPGIQEELSALSQLESVGGIQVHAMSDPTAIQFANEYTNYQPSLLHLAFVGVEYKDAVPKVYVTSGGETSPVAVDELLSALPGAVHSKLVVLNCCDGGASVHGPAALRVFAESLNTVAIGWLRMIDDRTAVDFARFFYSRLLDGDTVLDALVRYRALGPQLNIYEQVHRGNGGPPRPHTLNTEAISVIWTPSLDLIKVPVLRTAEQDEAGSGATPANNLRSGTRRHQTTVTESPSSRVKSDSDVVTATPVSIELDFEPQKWLNPALLKNGRPSILRLGLSADRPLSPVGLCIRCDTGDGVSSVRQTLSLGRGFQPVSANAIQFPVLYHLIEAGVPRRQVNFTVSCTHKGELLAEVTRSVLWMGQTEWLDKPDTWHFVPAFVNPNANKVLDVIDEADNLLRQIAEPTSAFSSYQTGSVDFVFKQVEAIFNCLRGDPFNLKYIAPPPLGVYIPGDQHTSGQRVRMPLEVIKRKRGTCHDLSILFASCLEQIQIYPLIILIRGHTFVGFWLDHNAHRDFWRHAMKDQQRRPQSPGRDWTITNFEEIRSLLDNESLAMLEVTKVTDRNASFSQALDMGRKNLEKDDPPEEWFDVAIDIQASRQQINPL